MKRLSTEKDILKLKEIWGLCFPNEDEFRDRYFKNIFNPKNTIVLEKNGEIVSMLQMLPVTLTNGDAEYSGYYIYAAATLPEFQGKGLMGELLNYSFELNKDKDFAFLITQNDSLFKFYEKFGFSPCFTVEKSIVTAKDNGLNIEVDTNYKKITEIANTSLKGIFHNKRSADTLKKNLICSGGKIYTYKESFCIFEKSDDFARIIEAIGDDSIKIAEQILLNEKVSSCEMISPFGKMPFGMVKPIKQNKSIFGYINILYN